MSHSPRPVVPERRRASSLTRRRRRGFALVAALAMLALSMALLVGALATTSALARSARSERGALQVEAHARRALATVLAGWGGEAEALEVGQGVERDLTGDELASSPGEPPVSGRVRIQRLTATLYLVAVDVRGAPAPSAARQRLRLLVSRPTASGSATPSGPDSLGAAPRMEGGATPIARWSTADLY